MHIHTCTYTLYVYLDEFCRASDVLFATNHTHTLHMHTCLHMSPSHLPLHTADIHTVQFNGGLSTIICYIHKTLFNIVTDHFKGAKGCSPV